MIGTTLGSYRILEKLGEGGMGEVYRARDTRLGRDVALKILPPDVAGDPSRLERFDREARAIAALNHPHIVTIHSTEEAAGVRFLTMELVDGETLTEIIAAGPVAVPRFLDIAVALADALTAAHQKQITHRDLKPGNVMISREGRVKVLDFGLARFGGAEAHGEHTLAATRAPITELGMIVGTMPYMSPEQIEGRPLDPRSDLFSLGVMCYELLSGHRPFIGDSSPALMSSILRDTPSSVTDVRAEIPEGIARVIARCLEKRPEDRVQTARDVYNELRHVQKTLDSDPRAAVRGTPGSETLRLAVLPFTTRGADAESEDLAAGLTDDITTSLARFRGLLVTAAQAARAFKDSPLDVRQIADRVKARYVVGGSVRRSGATFRVTAQLIDAQSATQLWTDTYNRRLDDADVFAIQDDVTDHIVATVADISGVLARSMVRAVRQQTTIARSSAEQLVLRSWGFQHNPLPADHAELRAALETTAAAQPENSTIWSTLANLYIVEHSLYFNPLPDPLGRALRAARRAIELDHANQEGWQGLALAHFYQRDRAAFEEASARAIQINPRNANTMAWIGNMWTHAGEYERGCALTERAMTINAGHPGWLHFAVFNRYFAGGEFERALAAARRVNIPDFFWMHFAIAAAAGHLGLADEGKAAFDAMARIAPPLADEGARREFVRRWYWPEDLIEALLEGVRRSRTPGGALEPSAAVTTTSDSAVTRSPSIAVLPFSDLSPTRDQEWFCDGIAEEILSALSPVAGLRVAARTSSFSFRGKTDDLRVIGEKLNVATVLEGSVRRAGNRVRITAQLSDAREGRQLWSERFDRELEDIFDVQDEIARAIVDRLKVTLTDGGRARLVPKATSHMGAYELLLKGRELLTRRGRAIVDAMKCFEDAVALDPDLSEAHALLGDAHRLTALYGLVPAHEAMPRARASAERALAIDPNQVEALATLANIASTFDWDMATSSALSDRALAVDPSHVRTLAERAISLVVRDQPSAAFQQQIFDSVRRARELDPLNVWVMSVESMCLACVGRLAEAVELAERAVAMDANNFTAQWTLVLTLAWIGRDDEAERAAVPALAMSGRHPRVLAEVAAVRAARGDVEGADAIHRELQDRARSAYVGFAEQATVAAAAGHLDLARELIGQALDARDPYIRFWKFPAWRHIWADPACAALLAGVRPL